MKPGRKKNPIEQVRWDLHVPLPLAASIELKLLDPITGKPRYGLRSQLMNILLEKWDKGEIQIPLGG